MSTAPLLTVEHLTMRFGGLVAVDDVSFALAEGRTLGLLGESGSGKSTIARAIMGLVPVTSGSLRFRGQELAGRSARDFRPLRKEIQMIFQDPYNSLNPALTVLKTLSEPLEIHFPSLSAPQRRDRIAELLGMVGLSPDAMARRPGEFSGGQRQRIGIARAIAVQPRLIICDECVSALDVSVQAQIINLLQDLQDQFGLTYLFISHDLAAVARVADRVVVMHEGRVVETGPTAQVLAAPHDPQTRTLVEAVSHRPLGRAPRTDAPLIAVEALRKSFGRRVAVDDVSLEVRRGRTLAVVGESGSGKTTLARLLVGVDDPDAGSLRFDGRPWSSRVARGAARTRVQLVQQNPWGALDPRWTIGRTLTEAVAAGGVARPARRAAVAALLEEVGLSPAFVRRRPAQLSGGQRQRVAIARALAVSPDLLVLDEPVSALDASVRARILDRLLALQAERDLAMVFVTHDLDVVAGIADDVIVMKDGRVVDSGTVSCVFADPRHPFTRELLAAAGLGPARA